MTFSRPRANSLQLSMERLRQWNPPRPPTPRRSTYPQPGTTHLDMSARIDARADGDIPPVPPLSYWEPDTPSPISSTSPRNPFLSPPPSGAGAFGHTVSPLLPASPWSRVERLNSPRTTSIIFARSPVVTVPELSPRFLNPRTPPLPPTNIVSATGTQASKGQWIMCVDPEGESGEIDHAAFLEMLLAVRAKVLEGRCGEPKQVADSYDHLVQCVTRTKRRQSIDVVMMKGANALRRLRRGPALAARLPATRERAATWLG